MRISITATPGASAFAPILWRGEMRECFEIASRIGYDGVELHLRHPEDIKAEEVQDLSERYALAIPTIGTGMAAGQDGLAFSSDDPAIRRAAVEIIFRHIELASRLHSGVTIGLIFGKLGVEVNVRARKFENAFACLQTCALRAEESAVNLYLEPINRYETDAMNTVAEVLSVIRRLGSRRVKLLADTFHMNIEETDLVEALVSAGELLGHVHAVDSNRMAPGYGHLDFAALVAALKRISYEGFLSFEVLPKPEPREAAAQGLATIGSLLA